ncbi:MAG TPA: hypothetical protein VKA89_00055 [Solirubrobacterales bacterium]|nr:hypothetical protein [Solirubrobacterales bacterium]
MRSLRITIAVLAVATAAVLLLAACGDESKGGSNGSSSLPTGSEEATLDPAEFTTQIDNPWWPLKPGSRWVYRETDQEGTAQKVVVTVTDRTARMANGVEARVVRDVVTEDSKPVEVTDDWYAQDADGNVWYLGEDTAEYENGKVSSREGSFEAGVDGAQPGVIMPADPAPGLAYREEYYKGEAEDRAKVLSVDEQAEAPFGHFDNVLVTANDNPLEPKVLELKFYARGVGPVLVLQPSGGSSREELIAYTP